MRDRVWILAGLIVFLGIITFPIWYNTAGGTSAAAPELQKPAKGENCIYPAEYMRANHMEILMDWRDRVVRDNQRIVTVGGKTYNMSLTGTCLDCHASKEQFCDKCHDYEGVSPYCWDCHVDPALARPPVTARAAFHAGPARAARELP